MRTIIINSQRHLLFLLVFAGLGSGGSALAATHDYTVRVDPELRTLAVEARFAHPVGEVRADSEYARQFLDRATDCVSDERLRARGRQLRLPRDGVRCLSYLVDLEAAARVSRMRTLLDPANIVVSPTLWLWQPRLERDDQIRVRFELPDGVNVSVPWKPIAGAEHAFTFGSSPQSGDATAVFGDFESVTERVAGVDLRIALLRSGKKIDVPALIAWVRATAENIALAYGRFPNPDARVVLIPVGSNPWGGNSAIPFGRVVRDGGETIEILINERRPISDYYREWTPTHEFSHLMLPYLRREQRWVSEGFATYYQNVLLTRAGQYTEQEAWQKLVAGLERGRDSVPELSPNAAAVDGIRNARMKIYWSGVSLALMADVELRQRSGGTESLDTVLSRLADCCLPSDDRWTGPELFRKLDTLVDKPLFMELYRRYADTPGFPDARPLLRELGVTDGRDRVRLSETAELAAVRRALTRLPADRDTTVSGSH